MNVRAPSRVSAAVPHRGFTLVELLVVIAIIGVLVALLLPAVQAAREAARRSSCSNNLKQLGLGFHNYESTHNALPYAYTLYPQAGVTGNMIAHGWGVRILPYIEQGPLHNQYNYSISLADPQNQNVLRTHLKVMQCPSTPSSNRLHKFLVPANAIASGLPSTNITFDESAGDYAPTTGVRGVYSNTAYANFPGGSGGQRDGALSANSAVRLAELVDGTSNTILLGELAGRNDLWAKVNGTRRIAIAYPAYPSPGNPAANNYGGGWGNPYNGENWLSGGLFSYAANNSNITQEGPCGINCINLVGRNLFSFHPGTAQVVVADGSVRGLTETVNGQVLAFMITRGKGEIPASE